MLILSRKTGEEILISDNIVVKIIAIEGKRVRLGIEAARDVSIVRGELIEANQSSDDCQIIEMQCA
jgi:carbon storage regulator